MSTITVNNPIYDKVHCIRAWEDNNLALKLVQGEGISFPDGTASLTVSHVKAPRFQLKDRQGVIDLSSASDVFWAVKLPENGGDDLLPCNVLNATDGTIEIPIINSVTRYAGEAYGEIQVRLENGTVKFYGVNACIFNGVPDDAIEQSPKFSALTYALQKIASLTPEGSVDIDDLKPSFASFRYAHERHSDNYESGVDENYADGGIYVDNAVDPRVCYIYRSMSNIGQGLMWCAAVDNGIYLNGVMQVRAMYYGKLQYRIGSATADGTKGTSRTWTPTPSANGTPNWFTFESQENKDSYDESDASYFGITDDGSKYPASKSVRKVIDAILSSLRDVSILGANAFVQDKTYNVHKDLVASYLEGNGVTDPFDADYENSALQVLEGETTAQRDARVFGYETHGRPNKITLTIPSGGVKIKYCDTVTGRSWTEDTTSGSISYIGNAFYIQNLIPGHLYTYAIYDEDDLILKTGTCLASGQVRMINAGGDTFNIRDLGGWECDGGFIKYDKIYRGAELNYGITITSAQQQFIKSALGITDEIDLRSESGIPSDTALGIGVDYSPFPLSYGDIVVNDSADFKPAAVIKHIAQSLKAGKTSYIHCRAGADRTATVCLLLEAICGVAQNDIDRDYELTSFTTQPNYNHTRAYRLRTDSHVVTNVGDYALKATIASFNEMEGTTLQDKIIRFLLRNGVTIDEINDIRFGLIEGAPAKITSPYGAVSVSKSLTHVSIDNSAATTTLYQPYTAQLLVDGGYVLDNVMLTMGNSDASIYYNNGIINIPIVTGNISITATASRIGAVGATYTLSATDWVGATNATQTVDLSSAYSITQNTKVDIDIDINTMGQLQVDGCQCLIIESVTENGATTLKAVAYGGKPTTDIVAHLIISEVNELSLSGGDNE